jgi:hypothetical protein
MTWAKRGRWERGGVPAADPMARWPSLGWPTSVPPGVNALTTDGRAYLLFPCNPPADHAEHRDPAPDPGGQPAARRVRRLPSGAGPAAGSRGGERGTGARLASGVVSRSDWGPSVVNQGGGWPLDISFWGVEPPAAAVWQRDRGREGIGWSSSLLTLRGVAQTAEGFAKGVHAVLDFAKLASTKLKVPPQPHHSATRLPMYSPTPVSSSVLLCPRPAGPPGHGEHPGEPQGRSRPSRAGQLLSPP